MWKCRRSGTRSDTIERRAERARVLASLGELSAARQALEGAALAPGDEVTLAALRDRQRPPPEPREPIPHEIFEHHPEHQFALDNDWFLHNVRASKKGAAAGPSGMTWHIFLLLRNPRDSELLCQLATEVARAELPADIVKVIRMGRMTALKKPQGGVRGIVVGDIMRRLVARTMAKALGTKFQEATAPYQYPLTTWSGCESVAHVLQGLTDLDREANSDVCRRSWSV